MNTFNTLPQRIGGWLADRPSSYLVIGIVLMTLSHLQFNAAVLAWVCMVPFLLYLRIPSIRFKVLKFALALLVAWSLIVWKIISDPIPIGLIFMYSVPITLIHLPGYLVWAKGSAIRYGSLLFPAIMVTMEWLQYSYTPLGSWGAMAYTQEGKLAILQSLSLFGLGGLSFLLYSFNMWVTGLIEPTTQVRRIVSWVAPVLLLLLVFGELRLDWYGSTDKDMLSVAAVGTESEVGGLPLPERERNAKDFRHVLERTRKAAEAGAKLVVWNEAAFVTEPSYEAEWIGEMKEVAAQTGSHVVASYVNVVSVDPFRFENKYHHISGNGQLQATYHKHEPVPGEPAVKGREPFELINLNGSKLGGAICYDYDFPYIARGFANADIVAVPSSDWRGINPLHTQMAAFRAIEQGHSILRSTRFGLSAAIDPMGRLVGEVSAFDKNSGVMVSALPAQKVGTLYSVVGDIPVYASLVYLLMVFVRNVLRD